MSERGKDFFNGLAARWDGMRAADDAKIAALVGLAGLETGDAVLDAGCGTGVLVPHLRRAVGAEGRITAVDFAAGMVARAREKFGGYANVAFVAGDVWEFAPDEPLDAVVCFNFFPHAGDKPGFVARMRGLLRAGGSLVIMHDMSRAAVNAIHRDSAAVAEDRLPAGTEVGRMLAAAGYEVSRIIDDEDRYFVRAVKVMGRD